MAQIRHGLPPAATERYLSPRILFFTQRQWYYNALTGYNLMKYMLFPIVLLITVAASAEPPLSLSERHIPGTEPTRFLVFDHPMARSVLVSHSGDNWKEKHAMMRRGREWVLDIRTLDLPFGRHEFKFIVDGEWESGDNRILHINEQGLLERPSDIIFSAEIEDWNEIAVRFRRGFPDARNVRVRLNPERPIRSWELSTAADEGYLTGYQIQDGRISFYFNPEVYNVTVQSRDRVVVAGNFNDWDPTGRGGAWMLHDRHQQGLWKMTTQLASLRPPSGETRLEFKFVINGHQWLSPPDRAPNRVDDGEGNVNLAVEPDSGGGRTMRITTDEPLDLAQNYLLSIDGLTDRTIHHLTTPGRILDTFYSEKELGVILDHEHEATTYRIFAPRARSVYLHLYETHRFDGKEPAERYRMWKDERDGVWEVSLLGLDVGRYYSFNIDGPSGDGEGFNPTTQVGDPYARAAAHAQHNSIVIDPAATNEWFGGWTDDDWETPSHENMVIYETHVRDFTRHPSSRVPRSLRGTYQGMLATLGTGTGLDHLREMGVNMIELLPIQEFHNNYDEYHWGYMTTYFFAPEASFARGNPLKGSQYYEFKHLVNELHREGFGVIIDVVYNHAGHPNIFSLIDRKYFFRLNPDFTFQNFSGVGNDIRSEAPMMRRFIAENVLYWMKEHHVDGFRFDLAELIDMETLLKIHEQAVKINPNVILISEPWSFRGHHKNELTGTGWAAWNDDFRNPAKAFVMGDRNRDRLKRAILGSVDIWTANPMQSVNYLESHDDMALMDEISTVPGRDSRRLLSRDVAANRLATTVLFTSLGIPMIHSGQEFLRSKHGLSNTYDQGDAINALRWTDRDRPLAAEAMAYYRDLIHLRQSPEGAAFRMRERAPPGYYQWIEPRDEQALGYIVNADRRHPGNAFVVLLNAGPAPIQFSVPLPEGRWRMIGNGRTINPAGITGSEVVTGLRSANIRVPSMSSVILMDGF